MTLTDISYERLMGEWKPMRKKSNISMIITATVLSALLFCSCGKVDDVPAQESAIKVENEVNAEPVSEPQTIDEFRELIASIDATTDNEQDMDTLLQCYGELRNRDALEKEDYPVYESLCSRKDENVRTLAGQARDQMKGIRYKSSISQEYKERLKTTGINGYRLVELGTVCCDNKYYDQNGLAIGSYKSSKGRTFWYEDGASEPEDKVIQVRDRRDRFANVVLTPKVSMYNVAFCFRGYAIVSDGTDTLTLYSAPISRSVYTVAKQVIAAGEFQAGTAAYNFVNGIVETVEGR